MIIKITIRFIIALVIVSGLMIAGSDAGSVRNQLICSSLGTVFFCIGIYLAGLTIK